MKPTLPQKLGSDPVIDDRDQPAAPSTPTTPGPGQAAMPYSYPLHLNLDKIEGGGCSTSLQSGDAILGIHEIQSGKDVLRVKLSDAVKALNSHAELLAACKLALPFLGGVEGRGISPFEIENTPKNRAIATLIIAISKAETSQ